MEFKLTLFVWACVQVGSVAFAQTNTTCRDVSDEVDELLGESDYLEFNDMVKPQVDGFQQDINLAFLGFDVIRGSLEVTNGTLSGLDSMSRSDYPSSECWTEDSRSLQGVFGYDTLTLSYSSMKTTFWFGEITGRLSCQISPTLSMTVTKKTDDCRLEVFTFTNPVEIDYDFSIDGSSWKGWFVSEVLRHVLSRDGSNTPFIFPSIVKASESVVESYFKRIWCDHSNPYPNTS